MNIQFTKFSSIYRDSNTETKLNFSEESFKCLCLVDKSIIPSVTTIKHGRFEQFEKLVDFFSFDENDYDKIFQLIIENKRNNLDIIFINNNKTFSKKLQQAMLMSEHYFNYAILDETLSAENENYPLNHLAETDTSPFFNICFGAHQAHISAIAFLDKITGCNTTIHRLAEVRAQTSEWASAIRNSDACSMVLTCLRSSELLATSGLTSSSGLTVEELAQIAYDFGLSAKNKIFNICLPETIQENFSKQTEIAFQVLWYYLLGQNNQVDSFPINLDEFQEYAIEECFGDVNINFYKSLNTGKWWFKLPFEIKSEYERHAFIPCTYQDYLDSVNGEMSNYLVDIFNAFELARVE